MDRLPLDPAGDHWIGLDGAFGTQMPRSPLVAAFREHVTVVDGVARLGGIEIGRRDDDGWQVGTRLTALEVRFLADRGHPHPGGETARMLRPRTDLHTHFAGCIRGADLVRIGAEYGVVYPRALLAEAGLQVAEDVRLADASAPVIDGLVRALALPIDAQCTHQEMSRIYKLRRPLTKHRAAFGALCLQVARDYAAMGVEYVELSLYDVFEVEVLRAAHEALPAIRRETGTDLRFLAALGRKDDVEFVLDMADRLRAYAGSDVIVGVDFMGHETTSTFDLVPQLRAVAAASKGWPGFVVRVHAGENPGHPENVRVAVETLLADGARMRIGHGLYGVDDETLARMAEAKVVVEFNLDSNFALNNVRDAVEVPLARYVARGAPVVLGTDGYAIYHADAAGQMRAAQLTGLSEIEAIARAEAEILDRRREADRALHATTFAVPATVPAARHYTDEVVARGTQSRARSAAALRAAIANHGGFVDDLDARFTGRRWVSIAGAWRKRWSALDGDARDRIAKTIDELVAGLAASSVLITGGTRHGVEGLVHAAARRHGAIVIGAVVDATPPDELDDVTAFCIVGRTLYDKPNGLYRLLADRGGSAVFVDGGTIVNDEIRVVANLRLARLFMTGGGASGTAAERWPRHAFRDAAQALARLTGERIHRGRRGTDYYYEGPNPSADTVCLRRHPRSGVREVLLVRRRADVGAEAGRWALPGGFVRSRAARDGAWREDVESMPAAALRELSEETGLDLVWMAESLRPVGVYEKGDRDPRDTATRWSRSHAFALELPAHLAVATLLAGDDVSEATWFALDALPPLAFDHRAIVADAVR